MVETPRQLANRPTPSDDSDAVGRRTVASDRTVTATVVDLLASITGDETTELDPLYGTIDPDALEAVCDSFAGENDRVSFVHAGCNVTVRSDGTVIAVRCDER